jgi:sulfate adenylyltransferase subunit 2
MNYLDQLESEAIYIIREAYGQFNKPVILFSGGKDSILVTHLAMKAFLPAKLSLPLLHIDTGHNFKETIDFRDQFVEKYQLNLIVGSVQESIDQKKAKETESKSNSRNRIQSITLLDAIEKYKIDCALGGGRRDEEKARAKERIFSHRDAFGQWNPRGQRPEIWNLYNGKYNEGEHFRVFPISNWTELDVWRYIQREQIDLPSLYFTHQRDVIYRDNSWIPASEFIRISDDEKIIKKNIRFRTLGDITITGGIESPASSIDEIIAELSAFKHGERGNRSDDKTSDNSMEDRKKEGYF